MKSSILYACLAVAGLLASACGFDPVGSCNSQCQQAITNGCAPEGTDCSALCEDAQSQYDEGRDAAEMAGCLAEFDAFVSCQSGGDPCDTGRCSTEATALAECSAAP